MANSSDLAAMKIYLGLMEELKARATSINTLTGLSSEVSASLLSEYGYLQLRMMCEVIALGCLVAHGDIGATQTKAFQKAYDPAEILRRLEALHPDFFPVPMVPLKTATGWDMAEYTEPHLTKKDLVRLYGLCGDKLHKGSVRRLLTKKSVPVTSFKDINDWGQKILNLMSNHRISRIGGKFHFVTMLDALGEVQVAIAEAQSS